jgi:hypothetical protein
MKQFKIWEGKPPPSPPASRYLKENAENMQIHFSFKLWRKGLSIRQIKAFVNKKIKIVQFS